MKNYDFFKENRNDAENSKKLREENSKNDNRQRDRTRDDRRDSRRDDRRRFEDDRRREDNRIDDSRAVNDRYDEYAREEEERRRGRGECNRMCDLLIFDIYQGRFKNKNLKMILTLKLKKF